MAGIKIDQEEYGRLRTVLGKHVDERGKLLIECALRGGWEGEGYSPSNDNHFRRLLYDYLGATPQSFTDTKQPSVDNAALTLLYQEGNEKEKEAVLARLRYEKAEKLYSTYIGTKDEESEKGLAKHLTPNWFVFQRINPLGARTGRRSSNS